MVWPSLNFNTPIPELDIRPASDLLTGVPLRHVLSNSFGFGGNTSSLLLSAI